MSDDIDQTRPVRSFTLPRPMIIEQLRLDTLVIGPNGDAMRPHLAVVITPRRLGHADFNYRLPAEVDEQLKALADAVRETLGGIDQ